MGDRAWYHGGSPSLGPGLPGMGSCHQWSSSVLEAAVGMDTEVWPSGSRHRSRRTRGGRGPAEVRVLREEGELERSQPLKVHGAVGLG